MRTTIANGMPFIIGSSAYSSISQWSAASGQEIDNGHFVGLQTDPAFISDATYRVSAISALIDAGYGFPVVRDFFLAEVENQRMLKSFRGVQLIFGLNAQVDTYRSDKNSRLDSDGKLMSSVKCIGVRWVASRSHAAELRGSGNEIRRQLER
jgi:hypothetical protein